MVVVAIGTRANPLLTATTPELIVDRSGYLVVDEDGMTSLPGVFAGGDIVRGAATVILAMGDGKRAGAAIERYFAQARLARDAARGAGDRASLNRTTPCDPAELTRADVPGVSLSAAATMAEPNVRGSPSPAAATMAEPTSPVLSPTTPRGVCLDSASVRWFEEQGHGVGHHGRRLGRRSSGSGATARPDTTAGAREVDPMSASPGLTCTSPKRRCQEDEARQRAVRGPQPARDLAASLGQRPIEYGRVPGDATALGPVIG